MSDSQHRPQEGEKSKESKPRPLGLVRLDEVARRWVSAPDDMPAKAYKAICEGAVRVTKFSKLRCEFQFTVVESDYTGVCLPGWAEMKYIGAKRIKPGCHYERYCKIALNGDLPDDLDPRLFIGKVFIVETAYRRTNGKSRILLDATRKKDATDHLRVVDIVSLSSL